MSPPFTARWRVVFAGVMILMCLGVAYSWGVFLLPIDQEMGWGRAKISFAVSVLLLVFSVFMAIGGLLEKKIGPRKTACIGGTLVGAGWFLSSFAQSPFVLYLCYGVVAGIGTGLSYMPSISSGIKWFPEKKGLVTGIIVFGFGFGTAFLSPLITQLIDLHGWRTTMMFCGIVFGAVIIVAAQFLKIPSASDSAHHAAPKDDAAFSPAEMIKTNSFRIMFLTYLIAMIAGMMTIGHLVAFISDKSFNAMQGALALTLLSFFNGVGRIVFGHASDIWGGKKILVLLFTVIGLAMLAFYPSGTLPVIYGFSALIGLCFGGFLAVYPALTAEYFGRRDFAVNYGLIFAGYGIGCFLGPLIGGWVHDATQSYFIAFVFAGALALSAAGLISLLRKPFKRSIEGGVRGNTADSLQVRRAADVIKRGGVVAFPTETVYGLGADAFNAIAVARIFEIKNRPSFDPLIVHIASMTDIGKLVANSNGNVCALAERFWPGPLTIVLPKKKEVPEIVTAGLPTVGIRMPDHPMALELIRASGSPIAAPSANRFGSLSPTTAAHVKKHLTGVDYILDAGDTIIGIESTIICLTGNKVRVLRHGAIAADEILEAVPCLKMDEDKEGPIASPGMLKAHYSPRKPMFILGGQFPQNFKTDAAALLSFSGADTQGYKVVERITQHENLREYAANLFSALHRLEEYDVECIVAEPVPEQGIGLAVMDRLRKASNKYSHYLTAV